MTSLAVPQIPFTSLYKRSNSPWLILTTANVSDVLLILYGKIHTALNVNSFHSMLVLCSLHCISVQLHPIFSIKHPYPRHGLMRMMSMVTYTIFVVDMST